MSVTELTKQLIAKQSFDDGKLFEQPMSDFLARYFAENLPWMQVTRQRVAPNRMNLFARDSFPTTLLVIDQIDTVVPEGGWLTNPLKPLEKEGKLYGLGASDSKGNVAAFLTALRQIGPTRGLAILLYVDEEYEFAGMKTFAASDLASSIQPKTVLSIDGNGSVLGLGCRGLIEFDVQITSESGHSADRTRSGALKPMLQTMRAFENWLEDQNVMLNDSAFASSVQMARLRSGLRENSSNDQFVFGSAGNRLPNYADAKIEVRSAPFVLWEMIYEFWESDLRLFPDIQFSIQSVFDYQGFQTDRASVAAIDQAIVQVTGSTQTLDPSTFGYLDLAMLQDVYPNAALCSFGVGEPGVNHRANEFVRVSALTQGVEVYAGILARLTS